MKKKPIEKGKKQVTQGLDIVADSWAGASNPHLQPYPQPHLQTFTEKCELLFFFHFLTQSPWTDGLMDQQIDGWTKPLIELRVRN